MTSTRAEICVVACAELFRYDGEILVSPMGVVPALGARLARKTFAPELLLTDGVAALVSDDGIIEGSMPYSRVFDMVWSGRRHVMMGASQLDANGNQNISAIGDHARPTTMLIGARGAPGNTACHATSYWIARHNARVFVPQVDFVCGVGTDRGAADLRGVVTNLGVFDFGGPNRQMRAVSLHPGVAWEEVVAATGFPLTAAENRGTTRLPSEVELVLLRETLDPTNKRDAEFQ